MLGWLYGQKLPDLAFARVRELNIFLFRVSICLLFLFYAGMFCPACQHQCDGGGLPVLQHRNLLHPLLLRPQQSESGDTGAASQYPAVYIASGRRWWRETVSLSSRSPSGRALTCSTGAPFSISTGQTKRIKLQLILVSNNHICIFIGISKTNKCCSKLSLGGSEIWYDPVPGLYQSKGTIHLPTLQSKYAKRKA